MGSEASGVIFQWVYTETGRKPSQILVFGSILDQISAFWHDIDGGYPPENPQKGIFFPPNSQQLLTGQNFGSIANRLLTCY